MTYCDYNCARCKGDGCDHCFDDRHCPTNADGASEDCPTFRSPTRTAFLAGETVRTKRETATVDTAAGAACDGRGDADSVASALDVMGGIGFGAVVRPRGSKYRSQSGLGFGNHSCKIDAGSMWLFRAIERNPNG